MRRYVIYRVPCPYNNNKTFVIKKYRDGHYYLNQELFVNTIENGVPVYKRQLFNRRFVRVSKRWINEIFKK